MTLHLNTPKQNEMKLEKIMFSKYGEKANRKFGHKIQFNDGAKIIFFPLPFGRLMAFLFTNH
jgi:hypothetical protein